MITVISMYRGHDAEQFVQIVEGELNEEQRAAWRKAHFCDEFYKGEDFSWGDGEDMNNMFFRTFTKPVPNNQIDGLLNVDGETSEPVDNDPKS